MQYKSKCIWKLYISSSKCVENSPVSGKKETHLGTLTIKSSQM